MATLNSTMTPADTMKNINMIENVEKLKKTIKDYALTGGFEFFDVLIKTANTYDVVTIQYDLWAESFCISHPSYNFTFEDIDMYALLAKE